MFKFSSVLLVNIILLSTLVKAQADLMISPLRVLFDGKKQRELLFLINTGNDTSTYSVSFIEYNMNEDGSMTKLKDTLSERLLSSQFIKIFPRKITLAPGETQNVVLQLKKPTEMKEGEYRSHLYFRAETTYEPLGMEAPKDTVTINVRIKPVYGISIPVIFRNGKEQINIRLEDFKIETVDDSIYYLKMTIKRNGNISSYGDLIVDFIPEKGSPYSVGEVRGLGVYTNINQRHLVMKLHITPQMNIKSGKFRIRYINTENSKGLNYAEEYTIFN